MVRSLGFKVSIRTRPHGIRHLSITEACKTAARNGISLEEIADFSRHVSATTLLIYRDRERNVQREIASLVASRSEGD